MGCQARARHAAYYAFARRDSPFAGRQSSTPAGSFVCKRNPRYFPGPAALFGSRDDGIMFFDRVSWCSRRGQFSGSDRKPGSSPQRRVPDLDICAIEADSWTTRAMAIRTVRRRIMPSPERKPRGRPFQSGNPGRPPGSKNKVTQTLERLAEGQAEQVFQKVTEQALAGDVSRQKIFLDRVIRRPKVGRSTAISA